MVGNVSWRVRQSKKNRVLLKVDHMQLPIAASNRRLRRSYPASDFHASSEKSNVCVHFHFEVERTIWQRTDDNALSLPTLHDDNSFCSSGARLFDRSLRAGVQMSNTSTHKSRETPFDIFRSSRSAPCLAVDVVHKYKTAVTMRGSRNRDR